MKSIRQSNNNYLNPRNQVPEFYYAQLLCMLACAKCRFKQIKNKTNLCSVCCISEKCTYRCTDFHRLAVCGEERRIQQLAEYKEIGNRISELIIWYQVNYLDVGKTIV